MKAFFKSLFSFWGIIALILTVRWIGFEPFVIPSGSMIPSLLVHDHVLVKKFSFGLRVPFTQKWLTEISLPDRGDIVVFKKPGETPSYFMIKRVIGLPGDEIIMSDKGEISVNGKWLATKPLDYQSIISGKEKKSYFPVDAIDLETPPDSLSFYEQLWTEPPFLTVLRDHQDHGAFEALVPEGHVFMMGDNRDNSMDSRFWGPLPVELLVGKASFVWLSCQETFDAFDRLCDPTSIRWSRFFHSID